MAQHELQRLLPRHFRILDLVLEGHSTKDIADIVGMTPQAISLITKSPIFQEEVSRRRETQDRKKDEALATGTVRAKQILEEAAASAAQTHVDLLANEDPRIRQASANAILDRVYEKPSSGLGGVVVVESGAIQLLHLALQESQSPMKSLPQGEISDEKTPD